MKLIRKFPNATLADTDYYVISIIFKKQRNAILHVKNLPFRKTL